MAKERAYRVNADEIVRLTDSEGWSLDRLATVAVVSAKTLKRGLRGEKLFLRTIEALAKALGVKCSQLLLDYVPSPPSDDEVQPFAMNIKVRGTVNDPGQSQVLVQITNEVARRLAEHGIAIDGFQAETSVFDRNRIISLIYGMLESGRPFWVFAAVRPDRYKHMLAAQAQDILDLYHFDSFGEIIDSGEGTMPPDDITLKVAEMYQTDPVALAQAARIPMNLPPPS